MLLSFYQNLLGVRLDSLSASSSSSSSALPTPTENAHFLLRCNVPPLLSYLDDMFLIMPSMPIAATVLERLMSMMIQIGMIPNLSKTHVMYYRFDGAVVANEEMIVKIPCTRSLIEESSDDSSSSTDLLSLTSSSSVSSSSSSSSHSSSEPSSQSICDQELLPVYSLSEVMIPEVIYTQTDLYALGGVITLNSWSCEELFMKKAEETFRLLAMASQLHLQCFLLIARLCVTSRMLQLIELLPLNNDLLIDFDDVIGAFFKKVFNLTDHGLAPLIFMTFKCGGLGIVPLSIMQSCMRSRLSQVSKSIECIAEMNKLVDLFLQLIMSSPSSSSSSSFSASSVSADSSITEPEVMSPSEQWQRASEEMLEHMLSDTKNSNESQYNLLKALSKSKATSAWMRVTPTLSFEKMTDEEVIHSIHYRLGEPDETLEWAQSVPPHERKGGSSSSTSDTDSQESLTLCPLCGTRLAPYHYANCQINGPLRSARHNIIKRLLANQFVQLPSTTVKMEDYTQRSSALGITRVPDLTISIVDPDRKLVRFEKAVHVPVRTSASVVQFSLDLIVTDIHATSKAKQHRQNKFADAGEDKKNDTYSSHNGKAPIKVIPFAMSSIGEYSKQAESVLDLFKDISLHNKKDINIDGLVQHIALLLETTRREMERSYTEAIYRKAGGLFSEKPKSVGLPFRHDDDDPHSPESDLSSLSTKDVQTRLTERYMGKDYESTIDLEAASEIQTPSATDRALFRSTSMPHRRAVDSLTSTIADQLEHSTPSADRTDELFRSALATPLAHSSSNAKSSTSRDDTWVVTRSTPHTTPSNHQSHSQSASSSVVDQSSAVTTPFSTLSLLSSVLPPSKDKKQQKSKRHISHSSSSVAPQSSSSSQLSSTSSEDQKKVTSPRSNPTLSPNAPEVILNSVGSIQTPPRVQQQEAASSGSSIKQPQDRSKLYANDAVKATSREVTPLIQRRLEVNRMLRENGFEEIDFGDDESEEESDDSSDEEEEESSEEEEDEEEEEIVNAEQSDVSAGAIQKNESDHQDHTGSSAIVDDEKDEQVPPTHSDASASQPQHHHILGLDSDEDDDDDLDLPSNDQDPVTQMEMQGILRNHYKVDRTEADEELEYEEDESDRLTPLITDCYYERTDPEIITHGRPVSSYPTPVNTATVVITSQPNLRAIPPDPRLVPQTQAAETTTTESDPSLKRTTSSQDSSDLSPIPFPQTQYPDQQ